MTVTHIISQIVQWLATLFRASGMLAKDANRVKYLVSLGNLCFAIGGILDHNIPLIASNAICLVIMLIEVIRNKRRNKVDPRHPELALPRVKELVKQYERVEKDLKTAKTSNKLAELEREGILVVQELGLVTPRLHDMLIQSSRARRGDIAREAAMEFVETPKPVEKSEPVVEKSKQSVEKPAAKPKQSVKKTAAKKASTPKKAEK